MFEEIDASSLRGKSYSEIFSLFRPREEDATHYRIGRSTIIEKSKFESELRDYIRLINK